MSSVGISAAPAAQNKPEPEPNTVPFTPGCPGLMARQAGARHISVWRRTDAIGVHGMRGRRACSIGHRSSGSRCIASLDHNR